MTFGFDFSGTVVSLPSAPRNGDLRVGDRVAGVVHGGLEVDEGSFAEYLRVETDLLFKVPKGTAMDEAATFGVAYVTAVQVRPSRHHFCTPGITGGKGDGLIRGAGNRAAAE